MRKKTNGSTSAVTSGSTTSPVRSRIREMPIAIVGMASLMPDAKALDQYWSNIVEKVNSIVDVPPSRWSIEDYYDADPAVPDKTYCKRGAFLPDIDFNPMEYCLPPNIPDITEVEGGRRGADRTYACLLATTYYLRVHCGFGLNPGRVVVLLFDGVGDGG